MSRIYLYRTFLLAANTVLCLTGDAVLAQSYDFSDWRGLWINRYEYRNGNANSLRNMIDDAASLGVTDILFQVRGQSDAYYDSSFEPKVSQVRGWDPLEVAVQQAHNNGMRLHAWINTMPLWAGMTAPSTSTPIPHPYYHENPSYRIHDMNGDPQPLSSSYVIANPILPEWQNHVTNIAQDIVLDYDVDGLHLDYTRWLGSTSWSNLPHDAESHTFFTQTTGLPATSANAPAYRDFIRDRITNLVDRIGTTVHTANPNAQLSAAVWRDPDIGYHEVLQDYRTWMEQDLIDVVIPMIYLSPSNNYLFEPNLSNILSIETDARVAPGIGVYLHDDDNGGPEFTVSQLETLYEHGTDGVTLYAYTAFFRSSQLGQDRQIAVGDYLDWVATALAADFDHDQDIDANDLSVWQDRFGATIGAVRADGDADSDGGVDGNDLLIWQRSLGAGPSAGSAGAASSQIGVPEPGAGLLAVLILSLAVVGLRPMRVYCTGS